MPVIKVKAGRYMVPVTVTEVGNKLELKFGFNRELLSEVKMMESARWNPERKIWTIANSVRNNFQLSFLMGENPYAKYDAPLLKDMPKRPCLREHQVEMFQHAITRMHSILGCEMGTGKSLVSIEAVEWLSARVANVEAWYIGPKAGVKAVGRELIKWGCKIPFKMITYDSLVRIIKEWKPGQPAPKAVIFDESTKVKTHSAQRSQAAMHLANAVRQEHGDNDLSY